MSVYAGHGMAVRLAHLAAACTAALLTCFGRLARRRAVTLCYHGVTFDQRDRFARQMAWIAGRCRFGRPSIGVTFDDAYANLLDNALPVTTELGIPVTVFVVTGNLGARPGWAMKPGHPEAAEITMTAAQIAAAGLEPLVTFGSHGVSHRDLTRLDPAEARAELAGSKVELESILRQAVGDFAFPYGCATAPLVQAARDTGYARVFTLGAQPNSPPAGLGGAPVVRRVPMSPDAWKIEFILTCVGAYCRVAPLRALARRALRRLRWSPGKLGSRGPITGSIEADASVLGEGLQ